MKKRIFIFSKEKSLSFRVYEIYFANDADWADKKVQSLAEKLFCDPVCENITRRSPRRACIVWFRDGVYDAEGEMAYYCAQKLGLANGIARVKFGRGHSQKELYNPLVEVLEKL